MGVRLTVVDFEYTNEMTMSQIGAPERANRCRLPIENLAPNSRTPQSLPLHR